ncbi:MAG: hydroxyacid dehydrogenase [Acidimicrobiaceae bacterium]|nr:hydroxyacid dehydrogenase [Acidimicrobiaceae bacterium]MDE0516150.1 hydroxyacid dehydrogenase [Acidimicrobiaceae bacterium]MDE0657381.1 hydroxyacid dehydrogenase [Acidimicrobiaceae bacterium]MXZ96008.1 hydroxyacid dehydrogenase [Acidimicrobiaceae bacterium]MYF44740.1 hydroxyacid dehydrogenase [Acidimicrobiaceae bacterium]
MTRPAVAITIGRSNYRRMFSDAALAELADAAEIVHHPGDKPAGKQDLLAVLGEVDACITSWGVAPLDADVVAAAPRLGHLAHMGGSVKRFLSAAVWERGMRVTSASVALARDVAETTLGLMIVGRKRIWPLGSHVRDGGWRDSPAWDRWDARELSRSTVGLIGVGNVGRHVIELLAGFETTILVADPYLSDTEAAALGVEKVDLAELMERSDVVSIHAPATDATRHMIDGELLGRLGDGAVLINTARGSIIDEAALVDELATGRIFAFLDVTDPEPPAPNSPLRRLDNVVVTPHIAGCIENCHRMGELAVEEVRRYLAGEPAINEVRPDMLDRIA